MAWQAHVTVAVVVEQEGRFLVVEERAERQDSPVFNQPAGHVEQGETLIEAACREALEETGWEVELTDLLGLYTFSPADKHGEMTYYRVCFAARALRHHPDRALDDGILRAVWMTPDELHASGRVRSPLVMNCVRDYLSGRRFPLDLIHEHPFAGAAS